MATCMDTMLPNNVGQGHIYSSFFPLRLLLFYYVKASEDDRTVQLKTEGDTPLLVRSI